MAKTHFTSVDEYIASQPAATQEILGRVRSAIREALPDAEEVISYNIPAYKLHDSGVLFFAGWKQHYSLYPVNVRVFAAFKGDLSSYEISKGTLRLPLSRPVPVRLIARIAKFRAKEVAQRVNAKPAAPKKRSARA